MFSYTVRLRRAGGPPTEIVANNIPERLTAIQVLRGRARAGEIVEVATYDGEGLCLGTCDVTARDYQAPEAPPARVPRMGYAYQQQLAAARAATAPLPPAPVTPVAARTLAPVPVVDTSRADERLVPEPVAAARVPVQPTAAQQTCAPELGADLFFASTAAQAPTPAPVAMPDDEPDENGLDANGAGRKTRRTSIPSFAEVYRTV